MSDLWISEMSNFTKKRENKKKVGKGCHQTFLLHEISRESEMPWGYKLEFTFKDSETGLKRLEIRQKPSYM